MKKFLSFAMLIVLITITQSLVMCSSKKELQSAEAVYKPGDKVTTVTTYHKRGSTTKTYVTRKY